LPIRRRMTPWFGKSRAQSYVPAVRGGFWIVANSLAQDLNLERGWTMKAGVVYPQIELGGDTGAVKSFAQAAEDLGYDHISTCSRMAGFVWASASVGTGWNTMAWKCRDTFAVAASGRSSRSP